MDERKYARVLQAVAETPWAIMPGTLAAIVDLVAYRADGGQLTQQEIDARIGSGPAHRGGHTAAAIAVLPLYGVLIPRATLLSEMSGGTSLERWGRSLEQAAADPDVTAILIDCHSPGGSTFLVAETAGKVRAARKRKPVWAIANALCASAAYHIASQAEELAATPSAIVGSIGVYTAHDDLTGANEKLGIKTTLVHAGEHKTEGHPLQPLTPEAEAAMQQLVDDTMDLFVNDVAAGRGVSATNVRENYGKGRVYSAERARRAGMVDKVETLEATIGRLAAHATVPTGGPRSDLVPVPAATEPEPAPRPVGLDGFVEFTSDMRRDKNRRDALASLHSLTVHTPLEEPTT